MRYVPLASLMAIMLLFAPAATAAPIAPSDAVDVRVPDASTPPVAQSSHVIGPFTTGCGEGQGLLVELTAGEYPARGSLVPHYQRLDVGGGGSWNYMASAAIDLAPNESSVFELGSPGAGFALDQFKAQINAGTVLVGEPLCLRQGKNFRSEEGPIMNSLLAPLSGKSVLKYATLVLVACCAMILLVAGSAQGVFRHHAEQCIDSTDDAGRVVTFCAGVNIADDNNAEGNGYAVADPLDPAFRYEIYRVTLYKNGQTSATTDGVAGSGSGPISAITPAVYRGPCADELYTVAQLRWQATEADPWTYDSVQSAVHSCP